jgi:hypothetical protein
MSTAAMMSPPSTPRSGTAVASGNPSRFRVLKRIALIDQHEAIEKQVYDPSAVSAANPDGLVKRMLTVTPEDLATLARNANASAAKGRPPVLQLGHTPMDDRPEIYQPKCVGHTANYSVADLGGVPCLFADLYCREDEADEAASYPNLSIERINFDDKTHHAVGAVALIRRQPERELPMVQFQTTTGKRSLVCYSKDRPVYSADEPLPGELVAYSAKISCFTPSEVRRRLLLDSGFRANYAKEHASRVAYSAEVASRPVDVESGALADYQN